MRALSMLPRDLRHRTLVNNKSSFTSEESISVNIFGRRHFFTDLGELYASHRNVGPFFLFLYFFFFFYHIQDVSRETGPNYIFERIGDREKCYTTEWNVIKCYIIVWNFRDIFLNRCSSKVHFFRWNFSPSAKHVNNVTSENR